MGPVASDPLRLVREVFLPKRKGIRSFDDELHFQSSRVAAWGALLLSFAALPYIPTDRLLHPDLTIIPAVRYGCSVFGIVSFVAIWFRAVRCRAMFLLLLDLAYLQLSVALITALTRAEPPYAGGYAFITLVTVLFPVRRAHALAVLAASAGLFVALLAGRGASFENPMIRYGLQDLGSSFVTAAVFVFILDRLRHSAYEKNVRLESERKRTATAHAEIKKLTEFSKNVNRSTHLDQVLEGIMAFVRDHYGIRGTLLQVVDRASGKLVYFHTNFQDFHGSPVRNLLVRMRIALDERGGTAASVIRRGKPAYFPRLRRGSAAHRDALDELVSVAHLRSALMVPLLIRGQPIGLLYFSNFEAPLELDRTSRDGIYAFCEQIAGAIQSSALLKEVDEERAKSERLLLNILPETIAAELKERGRVEPRLFPNATILFTDFKGFSEMSRHMPPEELVRNLDAIFAQFDMIADRHGLERLKTIGDSYMCAGGLPEPNGTHPMDACLAGLEMLAFMHQAAELQREAGSHGWEIRVGIHTGPVVAGVIGRNRFAYDVWGDTVNVASRMESAGAPDRLNISATTCGYVSGFLSTEMRGLIAIKNRGEVEMFFVNGLLPEFKDAHGAPNATFRERYAELGARLK